MDFEDIKQSEIINQDNSSEKNVLEKSGEFENQEESEDPLELAGEKIQSFESETEEFVMGGQERIDEIEREIGLPSEDIVSVRGSIGLFEKLEKIQREADILIGRLKEKFSEIFAGQMTEQATEEGSPLAPDEDFSPKSELQEIRRAPKNERPRLLREFKKKLIHQKEGLAEMQELLIATIRDNPDAPLGQLYEIVKNFGSQYGFTEQQKSIARELLQAYADKHMHVRSIREKYPDDRELYKALFNREPEGEVEVIEGPMTLYFRCHNANDYAWLHSQSFLDQHMTNEEIESANMSRGVSVGTSLIKGLEGTIIAELNKYKLSHYENVLRHEEQHAIKRLFGNKTLEHKTWMDLKWAEFKAGEDNRECEVALERWLRYRRGVFADERAKDEILAFFKDGTSDEGIFKFLTQSKEDDGLYDYLAGDKLYLADFFNKNFEGKFESIIKEIVSRVYEDEYQDLLKKSIEAVVILQKQGYSKDEIITLLIQEPLSRWEKVVNRLIQEQPKDTIESDKKDPPPPGAPNLVGWQKNVIKISDDLWSRNSRWTMGSVEVMNNALERLYPDAPKIGDVGLETVYGYYMDGPLISISPDGESAVFETSAGRLLIRFTDLLDPYGNPYKIRTLDERNKIMDEQNKNSKNLKERSDQVGGRISRIRV